MPSDSKTTLGAWIGYHVTVFAASACVMAVEVLATRLVAPFLGSSLYTWTSAIAVILAGISVGNLIGGRLADGDRPRRTVAMLFLASAVACALIPLVNRSSAPGARSTRCRGRSGSWSTSRSRFWCPRRCSGR